MKCTKTFGRKYTVTALNIICEKDPKCHGYEFMGNLGSRCAGELKFGDGSDDDILGMKGLEEQEKNTVRIKSRYTSDI